MGWGVWEGRGALAGEVVSRVKGTTSASPSTAASSCGVACSPLRAVQKQNSWEVGVVIPQINRAWETAPSRGNKLRPQAWCLSVVAATPGGRTGDTGEGQ